MDTNKRNSLSNHSGNNNSSNSNNNNGSAKSTSPADESLVHGLHNPFSKPQEQQQGPPRPKLTFGQRASDALTGFCGSWKFLILLFTFMFVWMCINLYAYIYAWDPYPFILLNFCLSCVAAVQAPIILMSQNRTAERDHIKADRDYAVNRKSEREVSYIYQELAEIKKLIKRSHILDAMPGHGAS